MEHLNGEEIIGILMNKNFRKQIKHLFRDEKVTKRKYDKL